MINIARIEKLALMYPNTMQKILHPDEIDAFMQLREMMNGKTVLEMTQLIRELAGAADAVVKHWNTPVWKYEQHTGEVIAGVRAALEKARQSGVTDHIVKPTDMVTTDQSSAVESLEARNAELLAALVEAREYIEDWASYASDYFREEHDLVGDLAKIDAVIERNGK